MNKPYLLIAWHNYYPQSGTSDWIGCYSSYEEARSKVTIEKEPLEVFSKGPRKGQVKPDQVQREYCVVTCDNGSSKYDYFEIVDLTEWTK
jgi:hypothetical protein